MRRLIKFLFSLAIGLVVFIVVMQRVGLENIKYALLLFFGFQGLVIMFLTFAADFFGVWKWKLILKVHGQGFSWKAITPLWFLGFSMSYLTPFALFGGEIFRIYFAKKKFPSLSWEKSISSVTIDRILDATVFFVFLIIGLLVFAFYGRFPTSFWGISAALVAGALLALLLIFYLKRLKKESVLEWLFKVFGIAKEKILNGDNGKAIFEAEKEAFRFFSLKNKHFWQTLGLTFSVYALSFLRCLVLIFFLTGTLGFFRPLAAYSFVNLAGLTPVPANLGTLELGEGFAFSALGFGFERGTVFSMVWRAADLISALIGLFFFIKFSGDLAERKLSKLFSKAK